VRHQVHATELIPLDATSSIGTDRCRISAYTHDIADLAAPAKSVIAQDVISGWSKLLIPGPARPDKPHSSGPMNVELFDLRADREETTNLAAKRPDEVRRLRALQDAQWKLP
jgi:hypothetical protein